MLTKKLWTLTSLLVVAAFAAAACGGPATTAAPAATEAPEEPAPTEAPETVGGLQIPDIEEGAYNVGMVLIGPHDDGGWSQAHYEGLLYVEENVPGTHVAYIELVPEGADSEQVFRSLARKGFDLIIGTSFGYMDPMAVVAEEFPVQDFIHLTGFKSNNTNYGNMFGAMEVMKYIAGMLAGSRAKTDGNPRIGYMATFPIPEELRLGNAIMLGAKQTCPECTLDVRWINTWHDPVIEKEGAASLFDGGAQVVFTGADTPAAGDVATEKGKWGVNYDWYGNCTAQGCLTTPYWTWGPIYSGIATGLQDGSYTPGFHYFDADASGMGLYGFMEGQTPQPGVEGLPEEDLQMVRDTLAAALAGDFTRFDVFSGPIMDNQGNVVVPEGEQMVQADLDQFPPGAPGLECEYCMYWWADGITAELPELSSN
jgi:basic membrane protein A